MSVVLGDCVDVMRGMDECSVDAVCCDPPYLIDFMGKDFDRQHHMKDGANRGQKMQSWHDEWAAEAFRVLKPSHYILAFGGCRTWHRLACAIEDAGFECRDTLMYLFGSGFPKGKANLKPAYEPIILARKPGPMRELGIDSCRIGWATETERAEVNARTGPNSRHIPEPVNGVWPTAPGRVRSRDDLTHPAGRWPANLILDEEAGAMLDGQTGTLTSGKAPATGFVRNSDKHQNTYASFGGNREEPTVLIGDSGGPSRFFFRADYDESETP